MLVPWVPIEEAEAPARPMAIWEEPLPRARDWAEPLVWDVLAQLLLNPVDATLGKATTDGRDWAWKALPTAQELFWLLHSPRVPEFKVPVALAEVPSLLTATPEPPFPWVIADPLPAVRSLLAQLLLNPQLDREGIAIAVEAACSLRRWDRACPTRP